MQVIVSYQNTGSIQQILQKKIKIFLIFPSCYCLKKENGIFYKNVEFPFIYRDFLNSQFLCF